MANPILFSICAFLMLMLLLSWVGYRLIYKPGKFLRQLGRPVIGADAKQQIIDAGGEPEVNPIVTILHQIGSRVPSSAAEVADLKVDLIRAGFRSENALAIFYGVRICITLLMLVLCVMMEAKMPPTLVMKLGLMASGIGAGWILPRFFLQKKVAKRQETLRLSLPDALDLMVVSIEAGLGLDQAIQHVARELYASHPDLGDEMQLVTLEMRNGRRRSEALRNFADRTGEAEFRKLVAILIQNDRFGTSMGESLRTHSDFMRVRRRQDAEERAGKVGVKLVFPIFFFILPSMLVVAAGPGLLQVFKYLFPMMKTIG
jgi:tight adherence protein C